jgi:NAD-dependent dihydropyrimidine dehydrogenase PreA subunit
MSLFINVEIGEAVQADDALKPRLVEVCPVDIFALDVERETTVEANLDECTLCHLCIDAAGDKVAVIKLYDNNARLE